MEDDDGNTLPDGCVADFYISVRGEPEIHMIGESVNGRAYCPYVPESSGDDIHVRAVVNDWEGLSTDIMSIHSDMRIHGQWIRMITH